MKEPLLPLLPAQTESEIAQARQERRRYTRPKSNRWVAELVLLGCLLAIVGTAATYRLIQYRQELARSLSSHGQTYPAIDSIPD